jgi:SAM-dependent methyltransferase
MKLKLPVSRFPRQYESNVLEMMDQPEVDSRLLIEDLHNLQTINCRLGGYRLIISELENFYLEHRTLFHSQKITILDFCTASADIPRKIVRWAQSKNLKIEIIATDINPSMLELARKESREYPEISFEQVNVLRPDFKDASFDFVFCSLALHHFSSEDAVTVLGQMFRIAKRAILVNDLCRSRMLSFFAKAMIPVLTSNPMTRFDSYLSTRRAFTSAELERLAFHSRIPFPKIRTYFLGRQCLVASR